MLICNSHRAPELRQGLCEALLIHKLVEGCTHWLDENVSVGNDANAAEHERVLAVNANCDRGGDLLSKHVCLMHF
eukprot:6204478-Pleurochrysis_carterae.AAC.1